MQIVTLQRRVCGFKSDFARAHNVSNENGAKNDKSAIVKSKSLFNSSMTAAWRAQLFLLEHQLSMQVRCFLYLTIFSWLPN